MMRTCRICATLVGVPDYSAVSPSITSVAQVVPYPLEVCVCRKCGHAQSSELPDLSAYYDSGYQISMASADYDQLYDVADGVEVFRTDKQADLILSLASLPAGARVLDYGAAKATTLQKVFSRRLDIEPAVFDVSTNYQEHWASWIKPGASATYNLPQDWANRFDLVTAHFVLEHVADPVSVLLDIRRVLRVGGELFLSVPDAISNPGDVIVADHINHFTRASLHHALTRSGFGRARIEEAAFRGAFVVIAEAVDATEAAAVAGRIDPDGAREADALVESSRFWSEANGTLDRLVDAHSGQKVAVYGAGFYGSYITSRIGNSVDIACFIDRNPHVRRAPHMGRPVLAPADLPTGITTVFAGLNPTTAREILADVPEWRERQIEIVYLAQ
jgi:SAM-dependent methyltransferase